MNNEFDDFSHVIDDIKIARKKGKFKIKQLKIEHFHWNSDDIEIGDIGVVGNR